MDAARPIIQIVDDDKALLDLYEDYFSDEGFQVEVFSDPVLALDRTRRTPFEVVICDITMPGMDGITFLDKVKQEQPDLPIIMVTARAEIAVAMEAMKLGAFDYVLKPARLEKLHVTVQNALSKHRLVRQQKEAAQKRTGATDAPALEAVSEAGVVARSSSMIRIVERARYVAQYFQVVLISGPMGSGKEALARLLHRCSGRTAPMQKVRCATGSDLEQEIFGGGHEGRAGLLEQSHGSTLLIKNVDQLTTVCQTKLLHYLDTGEVLAEGREISRAVDARIIVTTRSDLRREYEGGGFREDLYYRFSRIEFQLASLAERPEDVIPLAKYFLAEVTQARYLKLVGFTESAEQALKTRLWTGNVAELEEIISDAALGATGDRIDVTDFPASMR